MLTDFNDDYGEPIYMYTRKKAIEDGVLLDLSPAATAIGIRLPVAMTMALYNDIMPQSKVAENISDAIANALFCLKRSVPTCDDKASSVLYFNIERTKAKAICGPGDAGEPVITIMQPLED